MIFNFIGFQITLVVYLLKSTPPELHSNSSNYEGPISCIDSFPSGFDWMLNKSLGRTRFEVEGLRFSSGQEFLQLRAHESRNPKP